MKKTNYIILFVSILFSAVTNSKASTTTDTTYSVLKDAFVYSEDWANNYGTDENLIIYLKTNDRTKIYDSYIVFDTIDVPSNRIKTAKLKLFFNKGAYPHVGNNTFNVYACNDNWIENSITFNNEPAKTNNQKVEAPISETDSSDYEIEVASILRPIDNGKLLGSFGLEIRVVPTGDFSVVRLASKEHNNSALHPKLDIELSDTALWLYDIAFFADENGFVRDKNNNLAESTSQKVDYDENTSVVTAVPNDGYHFFAWADTLGNIVSEDNPFIVENVKSHAKYKAIFETDLKYNAVKDAFVNFSDPDVNYGAENRLPIYFKEQAPQAPQMYNSLIDFGEINIPTEKITSATLKLYHNNLGNDHIGSNSISIRSTTNNWVESSITWNNMPTADYTSSVQVPASTNGTQNYEIDVLSLLKTSGVDKTLASLFLALSPNGNFFGTNIVRLASKEHTNSDLHPVLLIECKETNDVVFAVTDGTNPIEGATVSLTGYDVVATDAAGKARITDVLQANHIAFTISKDGYVNTVGKVSVFDEELNKNVTLAEKTYTVYYTVTNGTSAIENGIVTFNNKDYTTDAQGKTSTDSAINGTYDYSVSAKDHNTISGKITINGTNESKTVTLSKTSGTKNVEKNEIVVYPNPAHTHISVIGAIGYDVVIYDALGNMVISISKTTNNQIIDVSALSLGTYFVKVNNSIEKLMIAR